MTIVAGNGRSRPNRHSFDQVYRELFPVLFRVAYRISGERGIAEDLCHEAFLQFLRVQKKSEKKWQKQFSELEQAKYWLIRVVRNISLNYERKKNRERAAVTKLSVPEGVAPPLTMEQIMVKEETRGEVQEALDKLPYGLRTTLVLSVYAGLSYREIGTILGITEGNVKVRTYRARMLLSELLKEASIGVP